MSVSYQSRLDGTLFITSHMAEWAMNEAGLEKPYGGMDWVQKEGWEIREAIQRSTEYAIQDALELCP